MIVKMSVFGVQVYPAKNEPMVILSKIPNNPTLISKTHDRKNALAIFTSITEILTIAFLINPDNKNNSFVKEFIGSFQEFVGKNITKIEINAEGDFVGIVHATRDKAKQTLKIRANDAIRLIHSSRDESKQTFKIRASDAICLSLILKMPIYTNRKYLKNLDEIYK